MGKQGQYNYSGINSQTWAAMSLFLQFLRDPKFQSIELEAPQFEDFNLVFDDGKKIICESKDWQKKLTYGDLKHILENIITKQGVSEDYEVLIVCSAVSDQLVSDVKHVKHFHELQQKFAKKGYSADSIDLLSRTRFWVVQQNFNERVIYSLFADLVNFWLPAEDIERFVDNLLIQQMYKGSQSGAVYDRTDFFKEVEKFKEEIQKSSDTFNSDKVTKSRQFNALEKTVQSNGKIPWGTRSLSAFSTRWDLMSFAMDRLKKRKNLDLEKWDELWKINNVRYLTFSIFEIFRNNLHTDKNRQYILQYIKQHTKSSRGFYQLDYFDVDVVKIITSIIEGENGKNYLGDAFLIIKDLITFNDKDFFYLPNDGYRGRDEWEKGEICKALFKLYSLGDSKLRQKIFNLLITAFNITQDDGEFNHHAPQEVYKMIREWLQDDFVNRFKKLTDIISDQYDRYYKQFGKKLKFEGWEHMGGGVSFGPGGYLAGDRHFIRYVLTPAINDYYQKDNESGWKFIKRNCITKTKDVSKDKPDFLNRAVYEIVLDRYSSTDRAVSKEAFEILKEFILSRRGIPHKSDLVYQTLTRAKFTKDKKWQLVNLTVEKYGIPVNPFAEKIVADLASEGYDSAKAAISKWFQDPKYYEHLRFDRDVVSTISALVESDFDFAVSLLKTLITSDYISSGKSDHFSAYKVAELLYEILRQDYDQGTSILEVLNRETSLSDDQQIIFAYSLFNHIGGNDDSDDESLLMKVYRDVVDPFLEHHNNDVTKITKRLSHAHCRDALVQFAVRLATKKKVAEALRIIEVFVDDPDPYLPGEDPEDPEDKYNEHKRIEEGEDTHSITSVRGWCGWALMKCSVLAGRDHMPEIVRLTMKLLKDRNYYVVHMGSFSLSQIANNRLTVLPEDKNTLFLNDDIETALKMAKEIEGIAFDLLEKYSKWPNKVQIALAKSILHVFDPIRALNKSDSLRLLKLLSKLPKEVIGEAAPLFIFFAELRVDSYKDWRFKFPGLYDDLVVTKKDAEEFKKITLDVIKHSQKEDPDSCFRFAASAEHLMREGWRNETEKRKHEKIALEYLERLTDVYAHNIFNLVYKVVQDKLRENGNGVSKWYDLLIKCFKKEAKFYKEQEKAGKLRDVYWYPSLYHSEILDLVHHRLGQSKFMEVAKIFFLEFPKEMELHESSKVVSNLRNLAGKDKVSKRIVKSLKERNPSKYWELDKKGKN